MRYLMVTLVALGLTTTPVWAQQTSPGLEGEQLKTLEETIGAKLVGADDQELGTVVDVIYDPQSFRGQQLIVSTPDGRQVAVDYDQAELALDEKEIRVPSLGEEELAEMTEFSGQPEEGRSLKETGGGTSQ